MRLVPWASPEMSRTARHRQAQCGQQATITEEERRDEATTSPSAVSSDCEHERARMMSTSAHLLAAIYPDREHAQVILDMLESMHRADTVTLVDSALITKDDKGKLQTQETKELTTRKGARRGAIIMGSLGLLFPPTII